MPTVGRPITAAARRVRYSRANPTKIKEADWQTRAWEIYDRLGEVFFMTRYRKGIAAKIDYYVAVQENETDDPVPVESGPVLDAFEELGGAQMLRRIVSGLMPHWDVPGEGYVVGFDEEPRWRVLSTQELKKTGERMVWSDGENEIGQIDQDSVYRVWSPHPRYSNQADSPTRHVLEPAEELILSSREIRARSMSRLPAGVWLIPEGMDLESYEEEDGSGLDGFANELVRKMSRPISDPGDPQGLVPWVIEMSREDIEVASKGFLSFARDFQTSTDQRKELLVRLATGLDLPAEIFLGLGDVNHWGQWLITEHAVSRHAAPTIDEILESLTYNWFRPQVSVDTTNIVLWRDLAPATVPTDRSELTLKAHDRYLISDDSARQELDFGDEDAPTPEEITDRIVRKGPSGTGTDRLPDTQPGVTAAGVMSPVPWPIPPPPLTLEPLVASELAEIDRGLLMWTVQAAEAALERAEEKVGARLKGLAEANGAKDTVRGVEPSRVASVLGPGQVALLAAGTLISPEDFAAFRTRLVDRIRKAQNAVRDYLARLIGRPVPETSEQVDANLGADQIIDALVSAVEEGLFKPDSSPDPVDLGEILDMRTPVAQVREGLSTAGGGPALYDGGSAQDLVGNGARSVGILEQQGYRTLSYQWEYGDPSSRITNFPPHKNLDGVAFDSWDDDVLSHSGWPDGKLRPHDHKGCMCSFVRTYCVPPILGAGEANPCAPPGQVAQPEPTLTQDDFIRALGPRSRRLDWDLHYEARRILSQSEEGAALLDFVDKWVSGKSNRYRNEIKKYLAGTLTGPAKSRIDSLFSAFRRSPGLPDAFSLHRGMAINGKIENVIKKYKVGDTLDLNLSSFTAARSVANDFAKQTYANLPNLHRTKIIIEWVGEKRGVIPVQNLTTKFFKEFEWIGGGRFEIVEVKQASGALHMKMRQIEELTVPE